MVRTRQRALRTASLVVRCVRIRVRDRNLLLRGVTGVIGTRADKPAALESEESAGARQRMHASAPLVPRHLTRHPHLRGWRWRWESLCWSIPRHLRTPRRCIAIPTRTRFFTFLSRTLRFIIDGREIGHEQARCCERPSRPSIPTGYNLANVHAG